MDKQLKVIISAEVSKLKKGMAEAKGVVSTFKNEISKGKDTISKAWTTIGEGAQKAAKVIATGLAAAGAALLTLGVSTKDYRTEQAKLTTAFEQAGASADTAKQVYNDLYSVLGESDVAVEAANHLSQMTTNQKELSEWTNICQGVYATFGDSLPIEGLTEAANETAKVGQVTGPLADALNWAKISNEEFGLTLSNNQAAMDAYNDAIADGATREDAFNAALAACNTEAEREALIREALNGTYDEAAALYEDTAGSIMEQNDAERELKDTLAELGEAMEPIITAFTNFANEALAAVSPYITDLAENHLPTLKEKLDEVANAIQPVIEFVVNNIGIIATIAGIILAIAAAFTVLSAAITAYTTVKTVYNGVMAIATAVQTAFAGATLATVAPILAVIAVIALIIAAIVLCVQHWDEIKAKALEVWENIKTKTQEAVDKVVAKFNELKDKAKQKIEEMKQAVSEKVEAIKSAFQDKFNAAKEIVSSIFTGIYNNIKNKIETAKNVIKNVIGLIKAIFSGDLGAAKQSVLNIFDAIKDGIKNKIENAKNTVKNVIDAIKGFFNFSWSLPRLKLPHISISGSFSIMPPRAPKFSISWYEFGGVFDNPHLFPWAGGVGGLGENGAEAIVPLEKNTKWLDRLATMLNEKQGSTPIIMNVDGKTFAQVSIDSINSLTRQTGNLALQIV